MDLASILPLEAVRLCLVSGGQEGGFHTLPSKGDGVSLHHFPLPIRSSGGEIFRLCFPQRHKAFAWNDRNVGEACSCFTLFPVASNRFLHTWSTDRYCPLPCPQSPWIPVGGLWRKNLRVKAPLISIASSYTGTPVTLGLWEFPKILPGFFGLTFMAATSSPCVLLKVELPMYLVSAARILSFFKIPFLWLPWDLNSLMDLSYDFIDVPDFFSLLVFLWFSIS